MAEDDALFQKGMPIRREVLGPEYVDASMARADEFMLGAHGVGLLQITLQMQQNGRSLMAPLRSPAPVNSLQKTGGTGCSSTRHGRA
jgi:hypothetical protein